MARDPSNTNRIIPVKQKIDVIKINSFINYDIENWDLDDEKDFKKYMKEVERIIRTSYEYRSFVNYLKTYMNMDRCVFLRNISCLTDQFDRSSKIRIEVHHEPLTLYDICIAVVNKRLAMGEDMDEFMVAKEVLYLHYKGYVGLIPLCETVHELVHNQYIFIPSTVVYGNYKEFVNLYRQFIEPDTLNILEKIERMSIDYDIGPVEELLTPYLIKLDMSGAGYTYDREEILNYIKSKLDTYSQSA